MTPRYLYAAFDFDGTLIDTFEGIGKCVQYALREEFNIDVPDIEELRFFCGPPLADTFRSAYSLNEEQVTRAVAKYRERYNPIGIYESSPFEGLTDALARLKAAGVKTAIASSKPIHMINTLLKFYSLDETFDAVVGTSGGVRDNLTKTQCIELALSQLGCPDKRLACMVGDRWTDAGGANEAGVAFIAAMQGLAPMSEFDKYNVVHFSDGLADTASYILNEL